MTLVFAVAASGVEAQSLPDGWTAVDVGGAALRGTATASGTTLTVSGAGTDVWGTQDQFMFVSRQLTGDGWILARVAGLQFLDPWAKAGVMMRESLSYGSRHAFALISGANGAAFQRRIATGADTTNTGAAGAVPGWVRLERRGSTFVASYSADGAAWTIIGSETIPMGSTILVGFAVTSHNPAALAVATFTGISIGAPSPVGLPVPWSSSDIGDVAVAGSASYASGVFTVDAAGRGVAGSSDRFRFTWLPAAGDVDLVARVDSIQNVDSWSKAGIMIRRSLAADSAHASLFVSADKGLALQWRPADGEPTASTVVPYRTAPWWVKLSRRGETITASHSPDGIAWTVIGTETLPLPATFYVGVAVSSHFPSVLARATFSNVSVATLPSSLPSGWLSSDIGSPILAGAAIYASGGVTVAGAGRDIWGTFDRFQFVYHAASVDLDLVSRVSALDAVDPWTKAGVMIRGSLAPDAAHASMFVSGGHGTAFQARPSAGGASVHAGGAAGAAPRWVKLSLRGGLVSAYESADGVAWHLVGTQAIALPPSFYVGVAVTSHDPVRLATARFDKVAIVRR